MAAEGMYTRAFNIRTEYNLCWVRRNRTYAKHKKALSNS